MIRYLTIKTGSELTTQYSPTSPFTTRKVEVEIVGVDHPKYRMMVDFIEIKQIIHRLDHLYLNDHFKQPTAENLARYFSLKFWRVANRVYPYILTVRVRVFEPPKSYAEVEVNREEVQILEGEV